MAEEGEAEGRGRPGGAGAESLALNAALDAAPGSEEARALLRRQARLVDLQIVNLEKLDEYETSHLRWRRFNDQMKGALQIMLVGVAAVIVFALGAAVWSAANDHGLVVESFSVPPDLVAQGQTGTALASHVMDRIAAMENQTSSFRAKSSYQDNWNDDIKVEIPDTGISVGEAYRFLVGWLGNQTHISGEIVHTPKGYALTARVGGGAGETFEGPDLDALVNKAAERIMAATQPYLYAVWLSSTGNNDASAKAFLSIAQSNAAAPERAWAYAALISERYFVGDFAEGEEYARDAIRLDPNLALAWSNYAGLEELRGQDEAALKDRAVTVKLTSGPAGAGVAADVLPSFRLGAAAGLDALHGDFSGASTLESQALDLANNSIRRSSAALGLLGYLVRDHDLQAARHEMPLAAKIFGVPRRGVLQNVIEQLARRQAEMALAMDDWRAAAAGLDALPAKVRGFEFLLWQPNALRAYAHARLGEFALAHELIEATPRDCHFCVRMRGNIRAAEKKWATAAWWFGDAANQAPSLPFAESDWGAMLLRKGDYDGAIAKLESAHQKGPRFADPLEMWGEALMQKNRCDLALAKFVEANKYAPNWGRLHLEWGEALLYSGDKAGAAKQFAAASHLDLTAGDRAALAKRMSTHG